MASGCWRLCARYCSMSGELLGSPEPRLWTRGSVDALMSRHSCQKHSWRVGIFAVGRPLLPRLAGTWRLAAQEIARLGRLGSVGEALAQRSHVFEGFLVLARALG